MASKRDVSITIKAMDRASKTIGTISSKAVAGLDRIADRARAASRSMAIVGGAMTAALGLAVKTAAEFQQAMANTQSVIGATADELERLTDIAREMGRTTVFSAKESASAMYALASAGFSADQVAKALSGTLKLAAATQSELSFTTQTVVGNLAAFGLEAQEADRVANVFAATISGSQATMQRLATAMSFVAPVARGVNLSIEETSAILGRLFTSGINASTAGTALRMSIAQLLKPTDETTAALKRMEVNVLDIGGNLRNFIDIIRDLENASITTADAMQIFGVRAGPAMLALINQGADAIDALTEKVTDTNKAAEMAAIQIKTFSGQMRLLKSAAQELQIVIGNRLLPVLTEYSKTLTQIVNDLSLWAEKHPTITAASVKFGGALGVTLTALAGIGFVLPAIIKGIKLLAMGIGGAATGGLVTAIVGLPIALSIAEDRLRKFKGAAEETLELTSKFTGKDMGKGSVAAAEAYALLTDMIKIAEAEVIGLEIQLERAQLDAQLMFLATGFGFRKFSVDIEDMSDHLDLSRNKLQRLREEFERFRGKGIRVALPPVPVAEPAPAPDLATEKAITDRKKLNESLAQLTMDELSFEFKQAEAHYADLAKTYKDDADMLALIGTVKAAALDKLRQDEQKRVDEDIEKDAKKRNDAHTRELAKVEQLNDRKLVLAERLATQEAQVGQRLAQARREQLIAVLQEEGNIRGAEIMQAQDQATSFMRNSVSQAKMIAATRLGLLDNEVAKIRATGATEIEIERFAAAQKVEINRLAGEQIAQASVGAQQWLSNQQAIIDEADATRDAEKLEAKRQQLAEANQITLEDAKALQMDLDSAILDAEEGRYRRIQLLRQRAFQDETRRIRRLKNTFRGYVRDGLSLVKILADAQERGWKRTLAAVIRFGTRMVANYIQARALEKLKQAEEAQTAAFWSRQQAERLAGIGAEALLLAGLATGRAILGDVKAAAAAVQFGLVVKQAAVAGAVFLGESKRLEKQAATLRKEGKALTITAIAVETAGEIAASGLEMAADASDKAAKRREEEERERARALEEEMRLRERILEMEGSGAAARILSLQDEIARYRELGIDPNVISRYEDLQRAQVATQFGTTIPAADVIAPTTPTFGGVPVGGDQPRVIVYQTNTFAGFLDTADEEQLRQLAIELRPYNDEIENIETTP